MTPRLRQPPRLPMLFHCRYLLSVVLFCGSFCNGSMTAHGEALHPNMVVMIADDMSFDDCGAYGHPTIQTPNIDRLANQGMRFDAAMLTCSSCSPSRTSILTGRYPSATGARELHLPVPATQTLLTTPLRKAGYWTVAAGKWHLGNAVVEQFDSVLQKDNGPSGCERWVEALRARPKDQPFFAWLAAFDPHRDYQQGTFDPPHAADSSRVPPYLPDNVATRADLAMYYDEIARFDSFVGKVLDELEQQGIAKHTIVVVMSDNGRPFPRCKTTVYDSGVRTPFVVSLPGVTASGAASRSLVSSVDLAPTLLDLAGLQSDTFQGVSFLPVLKNAEASVREHAYSEHNWHDYQACERSVRDQRYRYIRNWRPELPGTPPADAVRSPTYVEMLKLEQTGELTAAQRNPLVQPRPAEELYDLQSDPHELRNLIDQPAHQATVQRLRAALTAWQAEIDDPGPAGGSEDRFDRTTGKRLPKPLR